MQPSNVNQRNMMMEFNIYLDNSNEVFDELMKEYDITAIPSMCIFSKDNFIKAIHPMDPNVNAIINHALFE